MIYKYVTPIPQEKISRLKSDDITKKESALIAESIHERFNYVFQKYMEIIGLEKTIEWYDFDNGYAQIDGFFDIEKYENYIEVAGEFDSQTNQDFYGRSIPTKWLTYDFEEDLKKEFQQYQIKKEEEKKKEQEKLEAEKTARDKLIQSIKEKLSPEEFALIQPAWYKENKKHKKKSR